MNIADIFSVIEQLYFVFGPLPFEIAVLVKFMQCF